MKAALEAMQAENGKLEPAMIADDQKRFESWVVQTSTTAGTHVNKDPSGKYLDSRVAAKWSAWQASQVWQVYIKENQQ